MKIEIDKIIVFRLSGKYAHFRKFYTNASSLSYLLPPRTVVIGIIASVLKIPRDEYYEILHQENLKISVRIPDNQIIRKQTQSLNYLHNKYFTLLAKGRGKIQHSPTKLELLMHPMGKNIEYIIYVAGNSNNERLNEFEGKLMIEDFGYGVYLGQRQFRADIEYIGSYGISDFIFLDESEYLDSICAEENYIDCNLNSEINVWAEQMPVHFKQVKAKNKTGREPVTVKRIYFERYGRRLTGKFKNCYRLDEKYISFY